ncbi:NAD(P)H-binding protein [Blastococcus sp. TF02A_35]|uniref:SDR family oxidoreductase n=1 Tax=Blastococcus sp. TF02A-35 TaxID=2559612 RepID=UPI001074130F|nr:NAD(P)H-binding protein [Blastococcus sp. TF02A_35]TFV50441.1 NAD-dependent epimerase/dehydratase family protein [Blastococcus sp. TF02A_35]
MDALVTGATGRLGRRLVPRLQQAGHSVRQMSRRGAGPGGVRGDLATGFDLAHALAGAEVVVHAASDPRGNPWEVDVAGTRRLVEAVDRDRLRHLVHVSIVGVDRIPLAYYRAKYAAEQVLLASRLPVTLVRITQFHEFADELLGTARRGPLLPVPMGWRVQPVDVDDAAAHLVSVAAQAPSGGVVEFAGPEEHSVADLARAWAAVRAPTARVLSTPVPGRIGAALREGAAVPARASRGQHTWAQYLASAPPPA